MTTESDTDSTTKLEVDLPADHPFSYAAYQQIPGWSAKVTTSKLPKPRKTEDGTITEAPSKITWTADAASAIKSKQFQMFTVSLGPVSDTGSVNLAAHQTYSDGKVIDWDEVQQGSEDPEHPAPVLYVKDKAPDAEGASASNGSSNSGSSSAASDSAISTAEVSEEPASSADGTARWLGAGGLGHDASPARMTAGRPMSARVMTVQALALVPTRARADDGMAAPQDVGGRGRLDHGGLRRRGLDVDRFGGARPLQPARTTG